MEKGNILLKIYRDFSKEEAILLLKQEIASLNLKIGILKSEKSENNWLSLQDLKEARMTKACEELEKKANKKVIKLEAIILQLRKEKDYLYSKINTNELSRQTT